MKMIIDGKEYAPHQIESYEWWSEKCSFLVNLAVLGLLSVVVWTVFNGLVLVANANPEPQFRLKIAKDRISHNLYFGHDLSNVLARVELPNPIPVEVMAFKFIKEHEGCPLNPDGTVKIYSDLASTEEREMYTTCYGLNAERYKIKWPHQAEWWVKEISRGLDKKLLVRYPWSTPDQRVALISLMSSTKYETTHGPIMNQLDQGLDVEHKWRDSIRAAGVIYNGLVTRRNAEADLFFN